MMPEWQGGRHVAVRELEQTHLVIGLPCFGARTSVGSRDGDVDIVWRRHVFAAFSGTARNAPVYSIFSFASMYWTAAISVLCRHRPRGRTKCWTSRNCARICRTVGTDELDRAGSAASLVMARNRLPAAARAGAPDHAVWRSGHPDLLDQIAAVDAGGAGRQRIWLRATRPPLLPSGLTWR